MLEQDPLLHWSSLNVNLSIFFLFFYRKKRKEKAKEVNLYYGMEDPNTPSADPVFVDPSTLNPHAPGGGMNMLGSWEIPALTEKEEEARLKAKQQQNGHASTASQEPEVEEG